MRLLWAGVLLLVPLVAELANAAKCSGMPDAPKYATIRCFKTRGTCRAICTKGYQFTEKGTNAATYDCQDGAWVMRDGEVDRCDPACKPSCKNGGYCSAPNQCTCRAGYEGASCQNPHCDMECLNGGQCVAPNTCGCPMQWTGRFCEEPICDPPCEGECVEPNTCECEEGFIGDLCDEEEEDEDYSYYVDAYEAEDEDAYEEDDHAYGDGHDHEVTEMHGVALLVATMNAVPQEGITVHITGPVHIILDNLDTTEEGCGSQFDAAGPKHANDQCTEKDGFCVATDGRCNGTINTLYNNFHDHCVCCIPEKQDNDRE